ncbi:Oidioi.mRNA.OKI2018_I69.chr2.g4114.t1.cds [Oikopleura dioica]|uniref:Oidioi.mRNA.OKI2018_I69.chr2.g4114.t1.cds n=1 Tax=Oikopleura dioica TaxID=34765 RepID=A0ABN7T1T3_OIKDI|nr:Oidioi.mRNA.OKI2018_I69.chr2.g4114.t1.cds [Oikopleura dioica]
MSEEIQEDEPENMGTKTTTITGRLELTQEEADSQVRDEEDEQERSIHPVFAKILAVREVIRDFIGKIMEMKKHSSKAIMILVGAYIGLACYSDFERASFLLVFYLIVLAIKSYDLYKEKVETALDGVDKKQVRKISAFGGLFLMLAIYAESLYKSDYRFNVVVASFGVVIYMIICMLMCISIIKIVWRPILVGFLLQFFIAAFVIKTEVGFVFIENFSKPIKALLRFADAGGIFLFSGYKGDLTNFVFGVCPVIIFFSSLISMLYHIGIMDFVIQLLSVALTATYHMTYSEIFCVMTSGFSSIAGSVLGAYLKLGIDARALITSSFMSAPGSLMVGKLMFPEVTPSRLTTKKTEDEKSKGGQNLLGAAVQGALDAFPVCANITAMLIVFVAAIECLNDIVVFLSGLFEIESITLEKIFGVVFRPFVLLMGVPSFEAEFCARLLGEKIFFTEFMAFQSLATAKGYRESGRDKCDCDGNQMWLSELSETIMTYALCGFANIPGCVELTLVHPKNVYSSPQKTMGIMLGTMAGLAPKRKKVFSKILAKTCIAGTICCLIRGCIACILFEPSGQFMWGKANIDNQHIRFESNPFGISCRGDSQCYAYGLHNPRANEREYVESNNFKSAKHVHSVGERSRFVGDLHCTVYHPQKNMSIPQCDLKIQTTEAKIEEKRHPEPTKNPKKSTQKRPFIEKGESLDSLSHTQKMLSLSDDSLFDEYITTLKDDHENEVK